LALPDPGGEKEIFWAGSAQDSGARGRWQIRRPLQIFFFLLERRSLQPKLRADGGQR